jgi:protein ImuB
VYGAEALLFGARRLIGELAGFLSAKNAGVLKLNLDLYHEDESVTSVPFTLSLATRDPVHLITLVRERLFNLKLPSRVDAVALEACEVVPLRSRNFSLFAGREQEKENRAALIERLQARLGMDAVATLKTFPDHRPEFAWRFEETGGGRKAKGKDEGGRMKAELKGKDEGGRMKAQEKAGEVIHPSSFIPHPSEHPSSFILHPSEHPSSPDIRGQAFIPQPSAGALRPLWLLDPPRPLKTQGETPWLDGPLTLLSGPERIESGWWDGNDAARDYFVACDCEGAKFWLFREEQWFLHGIFA